MPLYSTLLNLREFNSKVLKNHKNGFLEKIFKEMRSKLRELVIPSTELDLIELLEPPCLLIGASAKLYRGTFLFTQVEVKVVSLISLDLDQLVHHLKRERQH